MANFLIVEDSPSQILQLKLTLQHHGHHVRQAADGEEAMSKIATERPEVVISDVLMPRMNGYDLCRMIKDDEALKDIPVILLTTLSSMDDIIKGLECGADSFLSKPYTEEELIPHINHILKNRSLCNQKHIKGATEFFFEEKRYLVSAGRVQTINFLFSTFTHAINKNHQLEQKNEELLRAIETIKTLRGLIPICAWCKKIRDDEGFWQSVEEYMTTHSEAKFTHGMCPQCLEKEFTEPSAKPD